MRKAVDLVLDGQAIRSVGREFGIPRTTLHRHVDKRKCIGSSFLPHAWTGRQALISTWFLSKYMPHVGLQMLLLLLLFLPVLRLFALGPEKVVHLRI